MGCSLSFLLCCKAIKSKLRLINKQDNIPKLLAYKFQYQFSTTGIRAWLSMCECKYECVSANTSEEMATEKDVMLSIPKFDGDCEY